jgi:hypothetical protein
MTPPLGFEMHFKKAIRMPTLFTAPWINAWRTTAERALIFGLTFGHDWTTAAVPSNQP